MPNVEHMDLDRQRVQYRLLDRQETWPNEIELCTCENEFVSIR